MALISQPYTRKLVLRPGAVSGGWKPVQASPQTSVSLGRLDPMAFFAGGVHRGQCPSKRTDSMFAQNCADKPARTADKLFIAGLCDTSLGTSCCCRCLWPPKWDRKPKRESTSGPR